MKRIFILNDYIVGGGAEIVMLNIIKHLHKKYKITVMTFDDDISSAEKILPENVKYISSKIKNNSYSRLNPIHYFLSIYNRLRMAYIRNLKFDIVISNKEGPCMQLVSKMKADKKIAWVHVDYQFMYWTKYLFSAEQEVKCMQCFDNVVCVSESACESIRKTIGDPNNLLVKYNPIEYSKIIEKAEESVEIEHDFQKPLFVAVGRIVEQKNFVTLAKICARLSKEFDFELWIVGDGDQRSEIESFLKTENCNCIKILGMQSNPYKYLAKADFLISPAIWESYGLVIQESLILGVPVLSTRCPAIEECFDQKFGILVDCNEEAIEKGMRSILENQKCINEYKQNIKKNYNVEELWETRLQKIEELLK